MARFQRWPPTRHQPGSWQLIIATRKLPMGAKTSRILWLLRRNVKKVTTPKTRLKHGHHSNVGAKRSLECLLD